MIGPRKEFQPGTLTWSSKVSVGLAECVRGEGVCLDVVKCAKDAIQHVIAARIASDSESLGSLP